MQAATATAISAPKAIRATPVERNLLRFGRRQTHASAINCALRAPIRVFRKGYKHWLLPIVTAIALSACQPSDQAPAPASQAAVQHGADAPLAAVQIPTQLLRNDDYAGFAIATLPPPLYAQVQQAWAQGHSRWPLDELPFANRLPQLMAALSQADAKITLTQGFERNFAGATGEMQTAAQALGVFGAGYLSSHADISEAQRAHYTQLVSAASAWASHAPLGDRAKGLASIASMTQAARASGLHDEADFARYGMDDSLRRISPVIAASKATIARYKLDLNAALDSIQLELLEEDGDRASVRMQYKLGVHAIDAQVETVRVDGRWYLADFIHAANKAVQQANAAAAQDQDAHESEPDAEQDARVIPPASA